MLHKNKPIREIPIKVIVRLNVLALSMALIALVPIVYLNTRGERLLVPIVEVKSYSHSKNVTDNTVMVELPYALENGSNKAEVHSTYGLNDQITVRVIENREVKADIDTILAYAYWFFGVTVLYLGGAYVLRRIQRKLV